MHLLRSGTAQYGRLKWRGSKSRLANGISGASDGDIAMTDHEKIQEMIRQKEQAPIALDPGRTALVIVDVQRFFTRRDSEFAQIFQKLSPGAIDGYFQRVSSGVLPRIQDLQQCFRTLGLP